MHHGICDRFFLGNLRWTSDGEVWASWRLNPLSRARTPGVAELVHAAHAALYRALPGRQVLLQGVLTWTDPNHIVDKMIEGIDLAANPEWAAECNAVIDTLEETAFGQRRFFLHVRLQASTRQRTATWARTAFNAVADGVGLGGLAPGHQEIRVYRDDARQVERELPAVFEPVALTEAEQVWLRRHAQQRTGDLFDPVQAPDLADELLEATGRAAVGDPLLDPSAISDLTPGSASATARLQAPFRRRFLKVITDTGEESYQSGLILSKVPRGMTFPASEFLGRIDDAGVPVDFALAMTIRSRHTALSKNKRALKQLNDQLDQVSEADVQHAAQLLRLHDAAEVLAEYHSEMQRDDHEVEIESEVMVSTAAATSTDADQQAAAFQRAPMNDALTWGRPIGAEADLFWAMQPGTPVTRQLRDYRQITHSAAYATAAPITTHDLGSDAGILLGRNISSPLQTPLFLDLFGDTQKNLSPSLAVVADVGAGKSVTQKKICGDTVDRGGRMIATDNSTTREWFTFAASLDCSKAEVDCADPSASLDPLRTMDPRLAGPVVQSLLTTLLNVGATDIEGRTIAKVVKPGYLRTHSIDSMGTLHRHLAHGCELPLAAEIADRIDVFSDPDTAGSLAAAIFDPKLPPIDLDARAVVIGTSNVRLPTANELASAHRFKTLPVDKLFGRALYALIAQLAKQVCFADPGDPAIFNVDEAHHVTSSEEAIQTCIEFVRYGRKSKAGAVFGSHNPEDDFPDTTLRGLIRNRLVMRQPDPDLARRSAEFLGFSAEDNPELFEQTVADIINLPASQGVGVMRDSMGRIGDVQIMLPARPERRQAVLTTPPERARTR